MPLPEILKDEWFPEPTIRATAAEIRGEIQRRLGATRVLGGECRTVLVPDITRLEHPNVYGTHWTVHVTPSGVCDDLIRAIALEVMAEYDLVD